MRKLDQLETLIEEFAKNFRKKGATDLTSTTVARMFAIELAKAIRKVARVTKKPGENE